MSYTTTVIIKDGSTGEALDFTKRILTVKPVLSKPSIIDQVAVSEGSEDALTGEILKDNKRTLKAYTATAAVGDAPAFTGATGQVVSRVTVPFVARQDNIITDNQDIELVKTASGSNDLVANASANFILSWKEKDLNEGLAAVKTKAETTPIYSSVAKVTTADLHATKPSGTQPTIPSSGAVQNDYTNAITGGKRVVKVPKAILHAAKDTSLSFIRLAISYLTNIGSPISTETFYPFSINGIPLDRLRVITTYNGALGIDSSSVTTVINLNEPGTSRNFNGLVSFVDTVPVYVTSQAEVGTAGYLVCSDRILYRKPLALSQIGTIKREVGAVVMEGGTTKNVGPNQMLIQYDARVKLAPLYYEEAIFIVEV